MLIPFLSKTEQLASVKGICKSKLDVSVLDAEINFDSYKILCCDGKGWGVSLLYKKLIKLKYSIDPPPWNWKYFLWNFTS